MPSLAHPAPRPIPARDPPHRALTRQVFAARVLWADWSRPERVIEILDLLERGPSALVAPVLGFADSGGSLGVHVAAR